MFVCTNICPTCIAVYFTKPSVLWHCWLGIRKCIQPVKIWVMRCWCGFPVWSEVQIVCIWSSWCHCRPKTPSSLASFKSRLVLPFWYRLTEVVLEKRPLNGCSSWRRTSSVKALKAKHLSEVLHSIDCVCMLTCVAVLCWFYIHY